MVYVCDVCGWEYDEEAGYPEGGSHREPNSKIFRKTFFARCAA